MTRQEHMVWTKERALEYAREGNTTDALASLFSDLTKHPETVDHPGILPGASLMMAGHLSTTAEVTKFIEGFN
uniref:hypothetical protein n=1 Tax=Trichocoleus desertorum TaxID=1481672 RepID=UPI0025B3AB88|nr:hypothetical protein [Trichocoleus desertorum]